MSRNNANLEYRATQDMLINQRNLIDAASSLSIDQQQTLQQLNTQLQGMLTIETADDIARIIVRGGITISYGAEAAEMSAPPPAVSIANAPLPRAVPQEVQWNIAVPNGQEAATPLDPFAGLVNSQRKMRKLEHWRNNHDEFVQTLAERREFVSEAHGHSTFLVPGIGSQIGDDLRESFISYSRAVNPTADVSLTRRASLERYFSFQVGFHFVQELNRATNETPFELD